MAELPIWGGSSTERSLRHWEDGQRVEVYKFIADAVQTNAGTGSGFMKATVPLLPQGVATTRAVIGGEGS